MCARVWYTLPVLGVHVWCVCDAWHSQSKSRDKVDKVELLIKMLQERVAAMPKEAETKADAKTVTVVMVRTCAGHYRSCTTLTSHTGIRCATSAVAWHGT